MNLDVLTIVAGLIDTSMLQGSTAKMREIGLQSVVEKLKRMMVSPRMFVEESVKCIGTCKESGGVLKHSFFYHFLRIKLGFVPMKDTFNWVKRSIKKRLKSK